MELRYNTASEEGCSLVARFEARYHRCGAFGWQEHYAPALEQGKQGPHDVMWPECRGYWRSLDCRTSLLARRLWKRLAWHGRPRRLLESENSYKMAWNGMLRRLQCDLRTSRRWVNVRRACCGHRIGMKTLGKRLSGPISTARSTDLRAQERAILHRMAGKVVELRPELWAGSLDMSLRATLHNMYIYRPINIPQYTYYSITVLNS